MQCGIPDQPFVVYGIVCLLTVSLICHKRSPNNQTVPTISFVTHSMLIVLLCDMQIMVFFVTANQTAFASELFQKTGERVLEMHSRKSQAHRTRTADAFRSARQGIMFSSDVSARGVDYPDVSLVIQVCIFDCIQSQCCNLSIPVCNPSIMTACS